MANMTTADAVLVSYPAYNAWPMAAKINKSSWGSAAHRVRPTVGSHD
jgi:hypothetical protein